MPGSAQEHRLVAMPGQCLRGDDSSRDGGREQFPVPGLVGSSHKSTRIAARNDLANSFPNQFECLPIASCCQGISTSAVFGVVGVPMPGADSRYEFRGCAVSLDGKRVIGVRAVDIVHVRQVDGRVGGQSRGGGARGGGARGGGARGGGGPGWRGRSMTAWRWVSQNVRNRRAIGASTRVGADSTALLATVRGTGASCLRSGSCVPDRLTDTFVRSERSDGIRPNASGGDYHHSVSTTGASAPGRCGGTRMRIPWTPSLGADPALPRRSSGND